MTEMKEEVKLLLEKIKDLNGEAAILVEICGGLDRIEQLQSHDNNEINHKALWIIETFFLDGDQYDEEIAPKLTKAGGFRENENGKGSWRGEGKKNRISWRLRRSMLQPLVGPGLATDLNL